ncbi:luciferase family protein [Streptomyces sp. NPDC056352]|uniref:luciferase domain-containing protein n=1 Tax=Streptomyces sp. NPDC056352 TaxID=3345791 RepID=UPI0035DD7E40
MSWPGLTSGPASCGSEYCLRTGAVELVHFHEEQEADVYLTRWMIAKLQPALSHSTALRLRDRSGWVTVRLDVGSDIDLLVTFVSAALQAVTFAAEYSLPASDSDRCSRHRLPAP